MADELDQMPWGRTIVLREGTRVELHPMHPDDAAALLRFHATLSAESTYLRFFSPHPELSQAELDRFTQVDHHDREAIVATVGAEIIGVARFDRLEEARGDAEVAFLVSDIWQGRGLGTALLEQLATRARAVGISRFLADTLPQNRRMLSVFQHAGMGLATTAGDGVIRLVLSLGDET